MAVILDVDVLIRGEEGMFDLRGWLLSEPDELFEMAAIAAAALWHGVERATGVQRVRSQQYLQVVLATCGSTSTRGKRPVSMPGSGLNWNRPERRSDPATSSWPLRLLSGEAAWRPSIGAISTAFLG